ncbi:hypothetical protein [Rhodovulum sp. 12E13]|uniref:hypothetical protein n=1 Tax=Rhodovulum sp. 12E13 TaxID=2203891 RepID=UPI0011C0839A|nr:hypothetical protein [Rhodovulum sp. 12E13]
MRPLKPTSDGRGLVGEMPGSPGSCRPAGRRTPKRQATRYKTGLADHPCEVGPHRACLRAADPCRGAGIMVGQKGREFVCRGDRAGAKDRAERRCVVRLHPYRRNDGARVSDEKVECLAGGVGLRLPPPALAGRRRRSAGAVGAGRADSEVQEQRPVEYKRPGSVAPEAIPRLRGASQGQGGAIRLAAAGGGRQGAALLG